MELTLFLNHRCNLRCTYCYTGRKFNKAMPLDVARQAIDFGLDQADLGFLVLSFFGGEPLLETERIEQILDFAKPMAKEKNKSIACFVATNGTILNTRILKLLSEHRFNVQLSLDGCPQAQDATRRFRNGRSSYEKIEKNLKRFIAEGFNPRVVAVIDPSNVSFMAKSFDHLMDLGVHKIMFSPNYTGKWDEDSCMQFESVLKDLGDHYIAKFRAKQDVRLDPINSKVVTHLAQGYKEKNLCRFGQKEIAVSPSGKLYPCDRLVCEDNNSDVCIGNLETGLDIARRDQMIQAKNTPDSECKNCELQPRCMYWCGCANYETTKNVAQVSPVVCWFERCFIAEADRIANTLYSEKNPTFLRRFYVPEAQI